MPIKLEADVANASLAGAPLSLKEELRTWSDGVTLFDKGDYESALGAFELIADSSKIHYNMGMILQRLQRYEDAVISFADATDCDGYLAVAYFQRGVCYYIMGLFENALEDFNETLAYLRGNTMIDYTQLGLDYKLYSCEALYNRALCHYQLGDYQSATADLNDATKSKQLPEHEQIDYAIRNQCQECRPFQVPEHLIYRPAKSKLENSKKKDYLGSSKVVAAVNEGDSYTGFSGAKLRRGVKEEEDSQPKQYISATLNRGNNLEAGSAAASPYIAGRATTPRSGSVRPPIGTPQHFATAPRSRAGSRPNTPAQVMAPASQSANPIPQQRRPSAPLVGRTASPISPAPNMCSPQVQGQDYGRSMTMPGGRPDIGEPQTAGSFASLPRQSMLGRGDTVKIKCHLGNDTRLLLLPLDAPFETVLLRLCEKYQLDPNTHASHLTLKYKDDEGEIIRMSDDEDWQLAHGGSNKVEIWAETN